MKTNILYGVLFASFILLSAYRCHPESDNCHRFIHFTNNSDKEIYYLLNIFDEVDEYNPALAGEMYLLKNNSTRKLPESHHIDCYESTVNEKTGMLYMFLFDREVVQNNEWETIRQNNMYLEKYELSINKLNEMNWRITYNGE